MGTQGKKAAPAGPTRRKVLVTALATGAGVAGARILGLRNLDASAPLPAAMDEEDMSMAAAMSDPVDEYDAMFGVPDDSFFGAQDLDPANVPQPRPATLPAGNARPGGAPPPEARDAPGGHRPPGGLSPAADQRYRRTEARRRRRLDLAALKGER